MQIHRTESGDRDGIKALHLAAFPEEESALVAQLAVDLLAVKSTPETLSLKAVVDAALTGHIVFSPAAVSGTEQIRSYILAPLAVHPDHQRRHVGTALVETGLQTLSQGNVDIVFVYGDPRYYGRFGFDAATADAFQPPHPLQYPFGWQAKRLNAGGPVPAAGQLTCVPPLQDPQLW